LCLLHLLLWLQAKYQQALQAGLDPQSQPDAAFGLVRGVTAAAAAALLGDAVGLTAF
jgi:hypothetical protein